MRRIIFLLALFVAACSPAPRQGLHMEPNQLLRQSSDLYRTEPAPPIKSVGGSFLDGKNIVIRYPDGRAEKIPRQQVWGYSNKKGRIFRLYGRSEYEIKTIGDLISYEQERTETQTVGNQTTTTTVIDRFYSETLNSKIFSSRKKALQDIAAL